MTNKKCLGCGIILQSNKINLPGYTPDLKHDYCLRCFKIKHYNANIKIDNIIDNEQLLIKINKKKCLKIFIMDFFNIYEEVIEIYNKINYPKIIIITKKDLIPRNIKISNIIDNIKNIYNIKDDIYVCSSKNKENVNIIRSLIKSEKEVMFMGMTNVGKSSLINSLMKADLTVSSHSNTTMDIMKIKTEDGTIYDTPGFLSNNFIDSYTPKKQVKPISYQLKDKYCLKFLDSIIFCDKDNFLTFYFSNEISIEKRKIYKEVSTKIYISANSDLVIKGVGFINIKKECVIKTDINEELLEVRPSIIGGKL